MLCTYITLNCLIIKLFQSDILHKDSKEDVYILYPIYNRENYYIFEENYYVFGICEIFGIPHAKMALEVHFELADCIYDGFTGNMQIDGQAVEVSSYYQKEYKDREISRITVVRCGQRSIHYAV